MENSPNDNDSSDDFSSHQYGDLDRNSTIENLNSGEELASESKNLPSSTTVEGSCKLNDKAVMLLLQAPNIDQLDETTSSTDVFISSRDSRNIVDCSLIEVSPVSVKENPTTTSVSVFEDSINNKSKTTKNDLSPFAASLNAEFASPPERGTIPVFRSLTKHPKEASTPSPEKRSVDIDAESTPIKKSKKTPESDLGKLGIETEAYTSKLRHSAPATTSWKSQTILRDQQMKDAAQKNEESKSLNTLSTPRKRTRSSVEPKASNLSSLTSFTSVTKNVHKSPTSIQIDGNKVEGSSIERKTLMPFPECSTDSNADANFTNPDNLTQIVCLIPFPIKGQESTHSSESTDVCLAHANLKTKKQTKTLLVSDASSEGNKPYFTQKKANTTMHLKTSTDITLLKSNVSLKQKDFLLVPDISSENTQPDLSAKETESAVRPVELTNRSSNFGTSSTSHNSESFGFESSIKIEKTQDSVTKIEPGSSVVNSAIETQISKSSPIISNPLLSSSCHLPRCFSSISNAPRHILEFDASDAKVRINRNRSDSSTQTSAPDVELRSQSKELSVSKNRGTHQRSLSDNTAAFENLSKLDQSDKEQGKFPRSYSRKSSTSCNLRISRRSVSDEMLTSGNKIKVQQDPPSSQYKEKTSRSLSETSKESPSMVQNIPVKDSSPESSSDPTSATIDLMQISNAYSFHQFFPRVNENVLSYESSRNNPKVKMQLYRNAPLLQEGHARFISGDASTTRNQPQMPNAVNPPYIDVFQGQASTSNYQPVVSTSSSFDQELHASLIYGDPSTSRNRPEVRNAIRPPYIDVFQGQASTSNYQPVVSTSSSFEHASAPRNLPEVSSNIKHPNIDVFEEQVSTSNCRPISTDGSADPRDSSSVSSDSSSGVSQSWQVHERLRGREYPFFMSRLGDALLGLRNVMRDILFYNGDFLSWHSFDHLFSNLFVSCTEVDRNKLSTKLLRYLVDKSYNTMDELLVQGATVVAPTRLGYEQLMSTVVSTLVLILRKTNAVEIHNVLNNYINFKKLFSHFERYFSISSVETFNIQDELSRIRMKIYKNKFWELLLRTSTAFEPLLMHLGANCPENLRDLYVNYLSEEDKKFFKNEF